ncbi:MAG: Hpy99I family type II restriction endonuclease, partial [Desulfobacteraceae bacterium]|nr:Hpy99I family type II restriction endonuclease [Desulfobacteraceae bacterium]
MAITVGNYVVATRDINNIRERSVGLVGDISGKKITVFFIGANKTIETDIHHIVYLDIEKTGKPYKKKICNRCHLLKDMEDFDINQTDAKGRKTTRPTCKECRVAIDGEPLKPDEKRRLEAIKPKGIFTCPICQKTSIVGITAKFVIDHDHKTGAGREWICDSCNTGLGRFKDDPELIQRVIDYLKN